VVVSQPDDDDAPPPRKPLHANWWWSGALWIVAGGAIAYYQWPVIQSGESIWANYLMAAVGIALAVVGAYRLWRDWQVERVRRVQDAAAQDLADGPQDG